MCNLTPPFLWLLAPFLSLLASLLFAPNIFSPDFCQLTKLPAEQFLFFFIFLLLLTILKNTHYSRMKVKVYPRTTTNPDKDSELTPNRTG
jgi:hypothetical protein